MAPRWLTAVSAEEVQRGDGEDYCDFIETLCRVTKDSIAAHAGEQLRLRTWQRELLGRIFARRTDGRLKHRRALIGVARKNAKSTLAAGIGLGGLILGPAGGEVYSCAADREQARIVFGTAKRMVELEPELKDLFKLYRDVIEFPRTGSIYRVLSAEAFTKEGLNPHLVLFDEVHAQPTRELWDVMALAMGAREEPLLLGITTAGVRTDSTGFDSIGYQLYQHGVRVAAGEIEDPTFFMSWWEPADPSADHRLESTQREGNPGYGDFVAAEDFQTSLATTPEAEFRTKRCNQWVATQQAWLPTGAWEACAEKRPIPDGARVVLAFDGSFDNDSTALVACDLSETPHLDVAACWERQASDTNEWRVPVFEVEEKIREACRRWQVVEIACDPARWVRSYKVLEDEHLPVKEFPQSAERMVPATQRFYEAVVNRQLTHSGDPRLARHMSNCVLKVSQRGSRIYKETKTSTRKIDLAVAAVMAHYRALGRKSGFTNAMEFMQARREQG